VTSRLECIAQQRLDSLNRIRARGINPYPHCYHPSHTNQEAVALFKQQGSNPPIISLAGLILAMPRGRYSFVFAIIPWSRRSMNFLRRLILVISWAQVASFSEQK